MSTQQEPGIEFSILPEAQQSQFRLLELPPELLDLLTSENAPSLELKSLENVPGQNSEQTAVLCTTDKTYHIRQVNTSNSLFVTQISHGPPDEIPKPRLEAISQAQFTLELQTTNDASAATTHIRALLPVYASTGHFSSKTPISKASLFNNIPASDRECEQAWTDLACFELDGEALTPSASVKTKAWESMLSVATAEGLDLTASLQDRHVSSLVDLNGSQWPQEVSVAVLRSMAESRIQTECLQLDEKRCAKVIGEALLKDRADRTAVPKATFISTWADLLPEAWRSSANLGLLGGSYRIEDGGVSLNDGETGCPNAMTSGAKAPAEAKSALGAKRKWHEKFRASKKTA